MLHHHFNLLTILSGIGSFAIADDAIVSEADLGVNFFVDSSCLGQLRSESCTKLLQEMNPEVKGDWFPKEKVLTFAP